MVPGYEQVGAQPLSIQLQPVLTGLSSPVFLTAAGDGSQRLFIVEQAGTIKALQPGASTPTVFLNIASRVLAGGERGLLGLAFHPYYQNTGRLFVYYTRTPDGALMIAEYHVSANPDIADTSETVLLTIPHPTFDNHNGGMLAFGPDGNLYLGPGDGGSGNDPDNNAQSTDVLLGKILRIDIDHPTSTTPYSAPAGNLFAGSTPGADEIYALGMRNPWRFSFDRLTGSLYAADVGQNAWEEIDLITAGGNYGWRVFEGTHCNDPSLCDSTSPCNILGYTCPIAEYGHTLGRCSITGGYVYRGPIGTLPAGAYVYGDYCSGEIFVLNGGMQSVLLDTARSISSFGEDEAGEHYLVGHGGTVERVVNSAAPCGVVASPTARTFAATGGEGIVAITATTGCPWTVTSDVGWIAVSSGSGTGTGTASFTVAAHTGTSPRTGTLTVAGQAITIAQGAAFTDVPVSHPFAGFIGKISALGITAGCGTSTYCPDNVVTRELAAVLIERAMGITSPPTPSNQTFEDVGPGMFSWPYVEDFVARGITAGCSATPKLFCPSSPTTREQMAVFLVRALDVSTPFTPIVSRFSDVSPSRFGYAFIHELARRGITAGCAAAPARFCPDGVVTRGQLAVLLVRAFGL